MIASREYVKDLIAKIFKLQTGEICAFMATKAPRGFLICDGSIYNINDYKNLARFFKDQFGSINKFGGDGETTFAVPDLRGEFLRGTGENSHTNMGNGADVGVHQNATLSPRFGWSTNSNQYVMYTDIKNATPSGSERDFDTRVINAVRYLRMQGTTSTTDTTSMSYYTARPTNTSVLYCIRY